MMAPQSEQRMRSRDDRLDHNQVLVVIIVVESDAAVVSLNFTH